MDSIVVSGGPRNTVERPSAPSLRAMMEALSGLSYDSRSDFLAIMVAAHAMRGDGEETGPLGEVKTICSVAEDIVRDATEVRHADVRQN